MATVIKYPSSYYDAGLDSDIIFVNPTYAYSDDGSYMTAQTLKRSSTDYITYYNWAFNIPTGSTINSVTMEVQWKCSTTASILSMSLQAYINGTSRGTAITNSAEPTTDTTENSSNTGTWSVSELNDNAMTGLCLRITVDRGATNTNGDILVDYVKATVDYTPPVSCTTVLGNPADTATGQSWTPTLNFTGTSSDSSTVEYNVQIDTVNTFNSGALLSKFSESDTGFTAGHPFSSGVEKAYTVQSADELEALTTYYWRACSKSPTTTNVFGAWATTKSFTTMAGTDQTVNVPLSTITATAIIPTVEGQKNVQVDTPLISGTSVSAIAPTIEGQKNPQINVPVSTVTTDATAPVISVDESAVVPLMTASIEAKSGITFITDVLINTPLSIITSTAVIPTIEGQKNVQVTVPVLSGTAINAQIPVVLGGTDVTVSSPLTTVTAQANPPAVTITDQLLRFFNDGSAWVRDEFIEGTNWLLTKLGVLNIDELIEDDIETTAHFDNTGKFYVKNLVEGG